MSDATRSTTRPPKPAELASVVGRIGAEVARTAAAEVDRSARFPRETVAALKQAGVLSAGVPVEAGGSGCSVVELSELCTALGRHCASSAMVLAMHYIQVASIVHHYKRGGSFEGYLRELVGEQRLIASVTSEAGIGGDLRKSKAALAPDGDRTTLVKESTCVSYGAFADDLLITCRTDEESPASAQSLVLARRGEFELDRRGEWDALGMRGTCSPAFTVRIDVPAHQVLETPFAEIAIRTMVPLSHVLWSSVWLGIATDAVSRAAEVVRKKHLAQPDRASGAAERLAHLDSRLQMMRDGIRTVAEDYDRAHAAGDGAHLSSLGFALAVGNLKINSSELVVEIVAGALRVCGFQGYLNDSECSVGRHLRDAYSAALMIANDRILASQSSLMLLHRDR